jgi:transketolase
VVSKYRRHCEMTLAVAKQIRRIILGQSRRANVGHIGSALSVADILAVLYHDILSIPSPRDPERDRFILSKGHSALALYAALSLKGWLEEQELSTFCGEGSRLSVHPEYGVPGVELATGSLGQGLSFGAGAALAARLQNSNRRVFVLLSDAECDEGSVWEAALFAAHHRLSNLVAVVDRNGQQALGRTEEILALDPFAAKWQSFGWQTSELNGHDLEALRSTLQSVGQHNGKPQVVIARTTFGKGVSYMQGQIKWHYWPMSDTEYSQAVAELEAAP